MSNINDGVIFKEREDLVEEIYNWIKNNNESMVDSESINEPNIICINADWGQGKTFFVKEGLMKMLDDSEDENNYKYNLKYIDAWESEKYRNPYISLIENTDDKLKIIRYNNEKNFGLHLPILSFNNGSTEQINNIENIKSDIGDILKSFEETFYESNSVIIIDELDRCNPEYALEYIEMIQHATEMKTIIVVANLKALNGMIKHKYGEEMNHYFDKIFKKIFQLPPFDISILNVLYGLIDEKYKNHPSTKNKVEDFLTIILFLLKNDNNINPRKVIRLISEVDINKIFGEWSKDNNTEISYFELYSHIKNAKYFTKSEIVEIQKRMDVLSKEKGVEINNDVRSEEFKKAVRELNQKNQSQ